MASSFDTGTSLLNLSRIYLYDDEFQELDASYSLEGADVILDETAFNVRILLTEMQRSAAVKRSQFGNSTSLGGGDGNGTPQLLRVDANFMTDLAGNTNEEQINITVREILDQTPPIAIGATVDYSSGQLTVEFSESIDISPSEDFENNLHLFSIESYPFEPVSLAGASVATSMGQVDASNIVIQLLDRQKALAIARSSTSGGDGPSPNILVVRSEAVKDVSQVKMKGQVEIPLVEIPDSVAPTILSAIFDYGLSELSIELSESADLTPLSKLNMSRIFLSNRNGSRDIPIAGNSTYERLGKSTVLEQDVKTIVIQVPEPIRLDSLFNSALVIGDGIAQTIMIDDNAIMDVAQNFLVAVSNIPLVEIPDTTPPQVISAQLDLGKGILVMQAQETIISTTPASSLKLFHTVFLENITNSRMQYTDGGGTRGGHGPGSVDLTGATFEPAISVFITIYLNEPQRVDAIRQSGTPGGDGVAQKLYVSGTPKMCKSCSNLGNSTSELLCTGLNGNVFIPSSCSNNVSHNQNESACEALPNPGNFTSSSCIHKNGTVLSTGNTHLSINRSICEGIFTGNLYSDGDASSKLACTGLTGNTFVPAQCNNDPSHNRNETACLANGGAYTRSQCYDKNGNDLGSEQVRSSLSACEGNATGNTFYEASGVFFDLQLLPNVEASSLSISELADEIVPTILSVSLDFSYGLLIFNASESIDIFNVVLGILPSIVVNSTTNTTQHVGGVTGQPNLAEVFISDAPGYQNISLHGAAVVPTIDATRLTLQLTEAQRVAALRISAQPGLNSDGTPPVADVKAGSLRDVGLNPVPDQYGLNISEIEDILRPAPLYALLNLSSRTLELTLTETADVYDGSTPLMDLSKIFLSNNTGDRAIPITGAVVPLVDTFYIVMPLTRYQSATANMMSGVQGGDGRPMSLEVDAGAFQDLVGLKNLPFTNVTVNEFPDLISPSVINATLDYSKGGSGCGFSRCALLTVEFSEFIREPSQFINASKAFLGNTSTSNEIRLDEALLTDASGYNVKFTLTEQQRALAITLSGTRGGDFGSIKLNIDEGFVSDYGANMVTEQHGIFVYETPDTDIPSLENVTLDLGTGVLRISADETLDFTPTAAVVFENMSIANVSGDKEIVLVGASVEPKDRADIYMQVTEAQRVRAIQISALMGGDGHGAFFETELGALRDVGLNLLPEVKGLPLIELPDTIPPELDFVEINYLSGLIRLHFSETIKVLPNPGSINLTKFTMFDSYQDNTITFTKSYVDPYTNETLTVSVAPVDSVVVNISMTPPMRWQALLIADIAYTNERENDILPPLGKGTHLQMSIGYGSVTDIALNFLYDYGVINNVPNTSFGPVIVTDPQKTYVPRFILNALVEEGAQTAAVVGYAKNFYFNGSGINSVKSFMDRAKWVPNHFTENENCTEHSDAYGQGEPIGPYVIPGTSTFHVPPPNGAKIAFTKPSPPGKPWKLCYKFADEPYKIFNNVLLEVKELISMLAHSFGNHTQAVVNYPKPFRFDGYGLAAGDIVSFARADAAVDADCLNYAHGDVTEDFRPFDDTTNGTATLDVDPSLGLVSLVPGAEGGSLQVATINFTRQSTVYRPHMLCYKFGIEPPKLYPIFFVSAKKLHSVNQSRAIVGSPQGFEFYSQHLTGVAPAGNVGEWDYLSDQVKWIQPLSPFEIDAASSGWQTKASISICGDNYGEAGIAALGTLRTALVRHPSRPVAEVSFTFMNASNAPLVLCYKFGSEPYQVYPKFSLEVIKPDISFVSRSFAVQGLATLVLFYGTTGATSGDAAKWVPYGSNCATEPGHGVTSSPLSYSLGIVNSTSQNKLRGEIVVMPSPRSSTGYDNPVEGNFTFVDAPTQWDAPWKLCFRFGYRGPFLAYPKFVMRVKRIDNVSVLSHNIAYGDTIKVGDTVQLSFSGLGLAHAPSDDATVEDRLPGSGREGDSIKLVPIVRKNIEQYSLNPHNTEVCNDDMYYSTGAGGTPGSILVRERKAHFRFTSTVSLNKPAILCYRFQGETRFQSFATVPLVFDGLLGGGGHYGYTRILPGANSSHSFIEALVVRGLYLSFNVDVMINSSLNSSFVNINSSGLTPSLPLTYDKVASGWHTVFEERFQIELEAALGISHGRIADVRASLRTDEIESSLLADSTIIGVDVSFEVWPESLVRNAHFDYDIDERYMGGYAELHGEKQIGMFLTNLINSSSGSLFSNMTTERLKILRHVDSSLSLPLTPATHRVMFIVSHESNNSGYKFYSSSASFSVQGFQPLFLTHQEAHAASIGGGGDGTTSKHLLNGDTYWMPNGIAYDHGTHAGYLDEFSGSGIKSTTTSARIRALMSSSFNPYPSFALSVFDVSAQASEEGFAAGIFTLNAPSYFAVEGVGTVKIGILRHGAARGKVNVTFVAHRGAGGSATGGESFSSSSHIDFQTIEGNLLFDENEMGPKYFYVPIADDNIIEATFETFEVRLESVVSIVTSLVSSNATIGIPHKASVRIYDYSDGYAFASSTFSSAGGYASYRQGWTVTNNGDYSPVWVDENGLYSVDQVFSTQSTIIKSSLLEQDSVSGKAMISRPRCASGVSPGAAIQLQCDLTCGADASATSSSTHLGDPTLSLSSHKVIVENSLGAPISLNGTGYVSTDSIVALPRLEMSVSMWMRSSDVSSAGILVSFASIKSSTNHSQGSGNPGDPFVYEFALYDQRSLRILIQDRTDGTWRIPALHTGVSLNDGEWNHVVFTWTSVTGRASLHKNGDMVFDTVSNGHEPYQLGKMLGERGRIVAGQGIINALTGELSAQNGFIGDLQNVRVYRRDISKGNGVTMDMLWPYKSGAGTRAGHEHLVLYWRFTSAYINMYPQNSGSSIISNTSILNLAGAVDATTNRRENRTQGSYHGITSFHGARIGNGRDELALSSCVEDDVWYFSAPSTFVFPTTLKKRNKISSLVDLYDGRIQFEMHVASFSGIARPARGIVEIHSSAHPFVISYVLPQQFETSLGENSEWTRYTITLREDFSWVSEPYGNPLTQSDMIAVLNSATAVRIRGDAYVCNAQGDGREAVYINNLRLESPSAAAILQLPLK